MTRKFGPIRCCCDACKQDGANGKLWLVWLVVNDDEVSIDIKHGFRDTHFALNRETLTDLLEQQLALDEYLNIPIGRRT